MKMGRFFKKLCNLPKSSLHLSQYIYDLDTQTRCYLFFGNEYRWYRNLFFSIILPASVDSASLMVSDSADVPDQSCSSDDLCSLEVQGSDLSPYTTLCTGCTSPEHSTRSHANLDHSESSITQDSITRSLENVVAPERDQSSITTQPSTESTERVGMKLTLPVPPVPEVQACASDSGALPSPSGRPRGARLCFSIWSPSSTSVPHPSSTSARTLRARRYRKLARIVRSTSDPISCNSVHRRMSAISLCLDYV